ncbi:hypothetical protein [Nocardia aurea]|uniref:hypothetical protein n=1 Tax=Nocardia aurea TaxID=2144174 RepID=UPI0033BF1B82
MAFDADDDHRPDTSDSNSVEALWFLTDLLLDTQLLMADAGRPDLVERALDLSRRLATDGPQVDQTFVLDFHAVTSAAAEFCQSDPGEMNRPGSAIGELYWNLSWSVVFLSVLREKNPP